MASNELERLRLFLNKECLWVTSPKTGPWCKIYHATTAISPFYKPQTRCHGKEKVKGRCLNVTAIVLKPKRGRPYVTIYINEVLMASCFTEVLFVRAVDGTSFTLIYFGKMSPVKDEQIPANIDLEKPLTGSISFMDILQTSTPVFTMSEIQFAQRKVTPVGRCGSWAVDGILFTFFIKMDMMLCCPSLPSFPSLSHIITLMTKCKDVGCVPCYGYGMHVNAASGFTPDSHRGCSGRCPCLMPCSGLESDVLPIRTHRNLLGLLFSPEDQKHVVALRIISSALTSDITQIICGQTESGKSVKCMSSTWQLLKLSTFYSRQLTYECTVLKKINLHSY